MLKILFFFDSFSPIGGGSQIALERWLKRLSEDYKGKVDFRLLTSSVSRTWSLERLKYFKDKLIFSEAIDFNKVYPTFSLSYKISHKALKEIESFEPQIIQLNDPSPFVDNWFIKYAKKKKLFVGGFFHTDFSKLNLPFKLVSLWQNYLYKRVDFLLCPSRQTQVYWKKRIKAPVFRAFYPINQVFFKKDFNFSKKLKVFEKEVDLVYVGRLSKEKNVEFLLKLLNNLPERFRLYFAGDGILKNRLKEKVRNLGLSKRVVFLGWLSEKEVIELLRKSHFLLLPSSFETFGIVYIEALSCYCPVLTLKTPVSKEAVLSGTGMFFDDLEIKNWKDKIVGLSFNKYKSLLLNIKQSYNKLENFEEKNSTKRLIYLYRKILSRNKL